MRWLKIGAAVLWDVLAGVTMVPVCVIVWSASLREKSEAMCQRFGWLRKYELWHRLDVAHVVSLVIMAASISFYAWLWPAPQKVVHVV